MKWVPINQAMHLAMPFTAKQVLAHYLETGRHGSALYGGQRKTGWDPLLQLSEF